MSGVRKYLFEKECCTCPTERKKFKILILLWPECDGGQYQSYDFIWPKPSYRTTKVSCYLNMFCVDNLKTFEQNISCRQDQHSTFFPLCKRSGKNVALPGVHLVCHHDMIGRLLDHAPQRALHLTLKVMLVLCGCFLALTGFVWCIWRVIAGKVFAAVAAACESEMCALVTFGDVQRHV